MKRGWSLKHKTVLIDISIIIMILPIVFLYFLSKVFPFWLDDDPAIQKQSV